MANTERPRWIHDSSSEARAGHQRRVRPKYLVLRAVQLDCAQCNMRSLQPANVPRRHLNRYVSFYRKELCNFDMLLTVSFWVQLYCAELSLRIPKTLVGRASGRVSGAVADAKRQEPKAALRTMMTVNDTLWKPDIGLISNFFSVGFFLRNGSHWLFTLIHTNQAGILETAKVAKRILQTSPSEEGEKEHALPKTGCWICLCFFRS